jgi:predicted nucleotidyltransferase
MRTSDTLARLRTMADAVRARGATSLYLFGSASRDQSQTDSDLDLFIDYDPRTRFNAFDLVGIKQFLEEQLGMEVDVTTRDGLHPMLRNDVEQTAVRVF